MATVVASDIQQNAFVAFHEELYKVLTSRRDHNVIHFHCEHLFSGTMVNVTCSPNEECEVVVPSFKDYEVLGIEGTKLQLRDAQIGEKWLEAPTQELYEEIYRLYNANLGLGAQVTVMSVKGYEVVTGTADVKIRHR